MAKLPLPKTKGGWAVLGGGALISLGAVFFFAMNGRDDDATAPRVDPAASPAAAPVNPADPAPVDPASPAPLAPPPAPPPVTRFYTIGANAGPVPLFTTENATGPVAGYITGCFSSADESRTLPEIKIVTPEGERTGRIDLTHARPGAFVPDPRMEATECTGTIMAAEDVPISEGYYRLAAGSNVLYTPRSDGRVKEHFEEAMCLRIVDAVNGDRSPFAAVILSVPGRRAPVTGWAHYDDVTIDAGCIPRPPQ